MLRRKLRLLVTVAALVLIYPTLEAQQGNQWYFGHLAGLNFNTNPTAALFDGQLNTLEGTSSVSDENGNILFYSDGTQVWNRNGDPMPNGGGLKGHVSSFQNSIIVPQPGNANIFYLFTTDAIENNGGNGYNYSIVDMTKDNGFGDITTKNVLLSGPSSERITAITGSDYKSYWVITNEYNSNIFRAYKIDCIGLNPNPVVSTVGRVMNESIYSNIGVMRVSGDGKLLLQTNAHGRPLTTPTDEFVQLFDFNNATGQITNPREIPLTNDGYYWGGEFSPDSKMLYLVNPFSKAVHQFDLSSGNIATIISSKQILPVTDGSLAAIAMGPDQKLYLATGGRSYLHVINDPNNPGTSCSLVLKQQQLSPRNAQLGLPNFNPNFFVNRPADFTYQSQGGCNGLIQFTSQVKVANATLLWDFGDGQNSVAANPSHQYADIRTPYLVKLTVDDNSSCFHQVVSKQVIPSGGTLDAAFTSTVSCDQLLVNFFDSTQSTSNALSYNWDFGDGNVSTDQNPVHIYTSPASYVARLIVTAFNGCMRDTFAKTIRLIPPVINAGPDVQVVSSSPVQLQATGGVTYHWSPATYLSDPDIANPIMSAKDDITYVVTGSDAQGCSAKDTLNVTVVKNLLVEVPNAFDPKNTANRYLRPLLRLVDHINYFKVYNRWGQLVFETKEMGKGWDGTLSGQLQPAGMYVWMIEVVDYNNNVIRKKGTSVLVR
jgi:PKD repeat protein